ncbi:head-tail connector protein [Mesobacillus stamsii]|uniref:Phage gp6-like head-tail connector protein n=1 Tax=Mesobacillus stamsii TaxID=225347 RepID=A0ABU0FWD5_9BACI|nr:head-tail connector protein [Mesobacillus stamsii]MDQ0414231.1 hypothetical protein [Mesobacillus stamsii]
MPLIANALTSLDAVKAYLKISLPEVSDDELLIDLINASSVTIENYCKRKFKEQAYIAEEFDGTGKTHILLDQYPVKSIESVLIDNTLIDPIEYKIKKKNGVLLRTSGIWPKGEINIAVSYTAGFSEIPYDLELACKHLVMSYYKSDIASFSTTFQDGMVFRPEALPAQVKVLLAPYKKVM